jgi:3-hydroxyacyl-[acyl-carrier-protein] dehydratase
VRWIWIDSIIEYEPGQRIAAVKNVSRAEEHLRDHLPADGDRRAMPLMPASLIIEGMAQTAGILVGAANRFQEKVILAKVVKVRLDRDVAPGQSIRYEATIERIDRVGCSTHGRVQRMVPPSRSWETIGEIDLMFSHLDQNLSWLRFPEENFVFSGEFKGLIMDAGLAELSESAGV